jgi:internalin A
LSGNPVVCINIPIEKAPNLKTLFLRDTNIEDLTKLQGLDNLTEINLTNTKVTNIAPLKKFKNLKLIEIDPDKVKEVDVFDGTEVRIRKEI